MPESDVLSPETVIPLEELRRRFQEPGLIVVNVLPRPAWEEDRIPGSISLPLAEIEKRAEHVLPARDQEIVVYCGGPT
jgi:rhodanese-related sulfurtransferase